MSNSDEEIDVEDMTPDARSLADGEEDGRRAIARGDERKGDVEGGVDLLIIGTGCATGAVEDGTPGPFLEWPDSEAGLMLIDLEPDVEDVEPRDAEG